MEEKTIQGQKQDANGKCSCERCRKKLRSIEFYTYKDGSKCELCKACLTAHIDNFDPQTFEWILKKMDVPYIPPEWNTLRDRAFAKDPYKMNGMSVIGKYLAKMKLRQFNKYGYNDSELAMKQLGYLKQEEEKDEEKLKYQAELKQKLDKGEISEAEYQTFVSTETQKQDLKYWGDAITGEHIGQYFEKAGQPGSYQQALRQAKNPFQEQMFMPESDIVDPGADLNDEDKMYLALKWGRLYKPSQWVSLEKTYDEFVKSFDLRENTTAARMDTLKKICKTSLKMDEAIDCGDIDSYQKLSRVYDSLMKSGKFTEAQKKEKEVGAIDSASAIVDFVEAHSGNINPYPEYICNQPRDIIDQIILDLKAYNKNLIYEDKSLAQEIERFLQEKRISEEMKKDKKEAKAKGLDDVELEDNDFSDYKKVLNHMKEHDNNLNDEQIENEYKNRRINIE